MNTLREEYLVHVMFVLVQVDSNPGGLRLEDSGKVFWAKPKSHMLDMIC